MAPIALLIVEAATVVVPPEDHAACAGSNDQIVVYGRRMQSDRYRLPLPSVPETTAMPRAEWGLGNGVRAGVSVSQSPLLQGASSPRVMVTVKLPF